MKKRKIRLTALVMMLVLLLGTAAYAGTDSEMLSIMGDYDWTASSSSANQHMMAEPIGRFDATMNHAYEVPGVYTGQYNKLTIWMQYCDLDEYSVGVRCTNIYNFTTSGMNLMYTSYVTSSGYYRLEGYSNKGVFHVKGMYSAG